LFVNFERVLKSLKMAKRFLFLFPCWIYLLQELSGQSKTVLWYKEPAEFFEESLVLGNGKLGATVFGGVKTDKIYLNDATLWSGEPVSPLMNPEAHTQIEAIRKALKNEDYALADQLQKKVQGKFSESYAPLGTLLLRFDTERYEQYYRSLDLVLDGSNVPTPTAVRTVLPMIGSPTGHSPNPIQSPRKPIPARLCGFVSR
jgi:alpha-L-fucosidase 2